MVLLVHSRYYYLIRNRIRRYYKLWSLRGVEYIGDIQANNRFVTAYVFIILNTVSIAEGVYLVFCTLFLGVSSDRARARAAVKT